MAVGEIDGRYRKWLSAMREALGSAPRSWSKDERRENRIVSGYGSLISLLIHDPLLRLIDDQDILWNDGELAWGVVIYANDALAAGTTQTPAPAYWVYGTSPALRDDVRPLLTAAEAIRENAAGVSRLGDILNNGVERIWKLRLDSRVTSGHEIFVTTGWIVPDHLPGRRLKGNVVPLLIQPRKTAFTVVAPCRFWPESFVKTWKTLG